MSKEQALLAVRLDAKAYDTLPQELKEDKDIVLAVLDKRPSILKSVWELFKDDFDVAKKGLEVDAGLFCYVFASEALQNNKELVKVAFKNYPHTDLLRRLPESLRADKEIVMLAVKSGDMDGLQEASEELQDDEEVVELALKCCESQMEYASDRLKGDKAFALRCLGESGWAYRYLKPELQNDRDIARAFFSINGTLLRQSPFVNDKEMVEIAIKTKASSIYFASEELKKDRDLAKLALSLDGLVLHYLTNFQNDEELVRLAYMNDLRALNSASEDLRNDRQFMLEAFKYNPETLESVADNLREDLVFVLRLNMLESVYNFEVKPYKKPRKK